MPCTMVKLPCTESCIRFTTTAREYKVSLEDSDIQKSLKRRIGGGSHEHH